MVSMRGVSILHGLHHLRREIDKMHCVPHMNRRVECPWAFAMALTLQKSRPQPVSCFFSPARQNPLHFGFDKFSANLQLLQFAGCEPALDWPMESISLWRSWETCLCELLFALCNSSLPNFALNRDCDCIVQWTPAASNLNTFVFVNCASIVMQWRTFYFIPNKNEIRKWWELHIDWCLDQMCVCDIRVRALSLWRRDIAEAE